MRERHGKEEEEDDGRRLNRGREGKKAHLSLLHVLILS